MIDKEGHLVVCVQCGHGNWVYVLRQPDTYACQRHGWNANCQVRKATTMHDINGKTVHVGDEITTYAFGLCKITGVEDENDVENQGASVKVSYENGKHEATLRLRVAQAAKVHTWKQMATEALAVQDASNLSGVVNSFCQVLREVRSRLEAEGKGGSDNVHNHPICALYSDKIAHLTGTQTFGNDKVSAAYKWAYDVKGGA